MMSVSVMRQLASEDHWAEPAPVAQEWRICVITDAPEASADIRQLLKAPFRPTFVDPARQATIAWEPYDAFVIDAWRKSATEFPALSMLLASLSHLRRPVFLVVGPSLRVLLARHGFRAGVNTCGRPLELETFTDVMAGLLTQGQTTPLLRRQTRDAFVRVPAHREALLAADEALERIFALGPGGGRLEMPTVDRHAGTIIESLSESGIGGWISGVRLHHDVTYQHCLLVTGIAIAFGQQLGFSRRDLQRIALGALLHDVGKARIPVGILDKPAALSPEERNLMTRHPDYGVEILTRQASVTDELMEIVRSHHEYLDGSGYPSGRMAGAIPDIVRLITVADIFGALIEKRAYREPLSGENAYGILLAMDGKLDMPIVRAVRQTAFRATN
jgi:putative nucleotidyltransferase with HDIG domain